MPELSLELTCLGAQTRVLQTSSRLKLYPMARICTHRTCVHTHTPSARMAINPGQKKTNKLKISQPQDMFIWTDYFGLDLV